MFNVPPKSHFDFTSPGAVGAIRRHITSTWSALRRSPAALAAATLDAKVAPSDDAVLYVPSSDDERRVRDHLLGEVGARDLERISIRPLPAAARSLPPDAIAPGLLYLPHPYVVPGGWFNEMYGWDSYFILLGLVLDDEIELARNLVDNLVYEIDHYGTILNANRTYHLTRSQPPFLTAMILEVFDRTGDLAWLAGTLPAIAKLHRFWTRAPRGHAATGLSRYWGEHTVPAPEVLVAERDAAGVTHYDRIRAHYREHAVAEYDVSRLFDRERDALTGFFYRNDHAMRESGFDSSGRFGPFCGDTVHYLPVDLNCLLYRMEEDAADILARVGRAHEAPPWRERARRRARAIVARTWNERAGLFFDYNFEQRRQSLRPYVTTFYPLWAGIASERQAARVRDNLPLFERAGGLRTSDRVTGKQWDAPYGWAPMQVVAVDGLRRYGFRADADRVALRFLGLVLDDYLRDGAIKEKYDVEAATSDTSGIRFGYASNEIGFGWTNGAFLHLLARLSDAARAAFDVAQEPAA